MMDDQPQTGHVSWSPDYKSNRKIETRKEAGIRFQESCESFRRESEERLKKLLEEWVDTVQYVDPGVYSDMIEKTKNHLSSTTTRISASSEGQ